MGTIDFYKTRMQRKKEKLKLQQVKLLGCQGVDLDIIFVDKFSVFVQQGEKARKGTSTSENWGLRVDGTYSICHL
jgi:hypothetical protein